MVVKEIFPHVLTFGENKNLQLNTGIYFVERQFHYTVYSKTYNFVFTCCAIESKPRLDYLSHAQLTTRSISSLVSAIIGNCSNADLPPDVTHLRPQKIGKKRSVKVYL
jgi:hypothetical protein